MKLSDEGLRLIKSFEGYHTRLKDGSCAAYLCPAGVPTIGFGCTDGVKLGMVWTEAEAEAALMREISKFEDAVNRNVTVEINQNEFDAMVSLSYNIGAAAFARSSVLRRLNKGDRSGAARAFHLWNRGGGRVLPGLVARRAREAALFMKPVEKPETPYMPQTVEASKEPPKPSTVAVGACAATGGASFLLPSIPAPPVDTISSVAGWQNAAETLKNFASSQVVVWAVCGMLIYWFVIPKIAARFSWAR